MDVSQEPPGPDFSQRGGHYPAWTQQFFLEEDGVRVIQSSDILEQSWDYAYESLLPHFSAYRWVHRPAFAAAATSSILLLLLLGATALWGWSLGWGVAVGLLLGGTAAALLVCHRLNWNGVAVHDAKTGRAMFWIRQSRQPGAQDFLTELSRRVQSMQTQLHPAQPEGAVQWKRGWGWPRRGRLAFSGRMVEAREWTPLHDWSVFVPLETFDANVLIRKSCNRPVVAAFALVTVFGLVSLVTTPLSLVSGWLVAGFLAGWGLLGAAVAASLETTFVFYEPAGDSILFEVPISLFATRQKRQIARFFDTLSQYRLFLTEEEAEGDDSPIVH